MSIHKVKLYERQLFQKILIGNLCWNCSYGISLNFLDFLVKNFVNRRLRGSLIVEIQISLSWRISWKYYTQFLTGKECVHQDWILRTAKSMKNHFGGWVFVPVLKSLTYTARFNDFFTKDEILFSVMLTAWIRKPLIVAQIMIHLKIFTEKSESLALWDCQRITPKCLVELRSEIYWTEHSNKFFHTFSSTTAWEVLGNGNGKHKSLH